eukprot:gene4066-5040_t
MSHPLFKLYTGERAFHKFILGRQLLRQKSDTRYKVLIVLPYLSVVSEKEAHLSDVLKPLRCKVKLVYTTSDGTGKPTSSQQPEHELQIVGMSATVGGVEVLSKWLQAELFLTNFRPVPLTEYAKCGDDLYKLEGGQLHLVRTLQSENPKDKDGLLPLCTEVLQDGHALLIFCSSRAQCESCARLIASLLPLEL